MQVINATPHDIIVVTGKINQDAKTKVYTASRTDLLVVAKYEKSGILPRVSMSDSKVGETEEGAPLHMVTYGDIDGLPDEQEGVFYIVSGLVAAAGIKLGRKDLMAPGGLVRDAENPSAILGCLFLQLQ